MRRAIAFLLDPGPPRWDTLVLRVVLAEFPAASLATTVTRATGFLPRRSARLMARSVFADRVSRSRTC